MIKAVLDTNALISGIFFKGTPRKLLEAALERKFQVIISPAILSELQGVIIEKFGRSIDEANEIEKRIRRLAKVVDTSGLNIETIKENLADNRILEAAVAGEADYIISGDKKHVLPLKKFGKTEIVSATQFLESQEFAS